MDHTDRPMGFQIRACDRLADIFKKHSRAFLADEPGLGKTFTSAMVINELAKKANRDKPFYVIYVAPNQALLEENTEELVQKYKASTGKDNIVTLQELTSPNDRLKSAYRNYLKSKIKKSKENEAEIELKIKFISEEIDKTVITEGKKREFVSQHSGNCYPNWNTLRRFYCYYADTFQPDRLAFAHKIIQNKQEYLKGKIVLLPVSAKIALEEESNHGDEKKIFKGNGCGTRTEFTKKFLATYDPGLIIWDEYHRYIKNLSSDNPFFEYEVYSHSEGRVKMRSLFVSATPYRTNISGEGSKALFDQLYTNALDDESEETALTGFEKDFAPLFCGGFCGGIPIVNKDSLIAAYTDYIKNGKNKDVLEEFLKRRMVRNERIRLQGGCYERFVDISEDQYSAEYGEILRNTKRQCDLLEKAGYPVGARKWSLSMPWILCFSTERTKIEKNEGEATFFKLLEPKGESPSDELFLYDEKGVPKPGLLAALPRQDLAMHYICKKVLPDRQTAQLIWMPPTVPLYDPGEGSIFSKPDHTKLLIFAEYRYLQRGGAILLSDYCRELCSTDREAPELRIEYRDIETDAAHLFAGERNKALDALVREVEAEYGSSVPPLYRIASPAACAERLGLDPEEINDAFNAYFNSPGVKEALWSWLCDNGYADNVEEGLLRYCAEGNLYAVMEELLFGLKHTGSGERTRYIADILTRKHSTIGVQNKNVSDGIQRQCGAAEELTGDIDDNGSGDNKEVYRRCSHAFNSPFYPMILFAGKGAQEGVNLHNYCSCIMHLTLPRGAVCYEQRSGRIDRYRSLLVRRRAAELAGEAAGAASENALGRIFNELVNNKNKQYSNNYLYPNWSIPNEKSSFHFEEIVPMWDYTDESCYMKSIREMISSYRTSLGAIDNTDNMIDLSTIRE